jgi:hypothetical protein
MRDDQRLIAPVAVEKRVQLRQRRHRRQHAVKHHDDAGGF